MSDLVRMARTVAAMEDEALVDLAEEMARDHEPAQPMGMVLAACLVEQAARFAAAVAARGNPESRIQNPESTLPHSQP